jgi:hypothetical protein
MSAMPATQEQIVALGFVPAGEILINSRGLVDFAITAAEFKLKVPQVYAWVVDGEVKYIGKAGKGVQTRFTQHRGGWRGNSVTGISKAVKLTEALKAHRVEVYARTCEVKTITMFGGAVTQDLNMIDIEEQMLITLMQPECNVAGK